MTLSLLALWSAPRCRSTAFLRMMAERGDFEVVHEPFSYVADFGVAHVGDLEVRSESDVMAALRMAAKEQPVFFKDTTDFHYPEVLADPSFLGEGTHTFMIRNPRAAIASHYRLMPELDVGSVGFARLYEIFAAVRSASRCEPVVIDADDLVSAPAAVVSEYCRRVGMPFVPHALTWSPGQLEAWRRAPRWHASVSASCGFQRLDPSDAAEVDRDPVLRAFLDYHLPFYEKMYAARLRV
jgi:hypothetical protein